MKPFRIPASWSALRFAACLAVTAVTFGPAPASGYTVNSTADENDIDLRDSLCRTARGECTLRAAVEQYNHISLFSPRETLTITLPAGVYRLTAPLAIRGRITIYGGIGTPQIECGGVAATLLNYDSLELQLLRISNCPEIENRWGLTLWGVEVESSDGATALRNYKVLHVISSTFTGNRTGIRSAGGAALFNEPGGDVYIVESLFEGNNSGRHGGAIFNRGKLQAVTSSFVKNIASGDGGAVYNEGDLSFDLVRFDDNGALDGGALLNTGGAEVTRSAFVRNQASRGGAIWSTASLQLVNSTVSGNSAHQGGGLFGAGEPNSLYLANATITQNFASGEGSQGGGGLYGAAILRNTILARNTSFGNGQDCQAGPTSQSLSQGFNVIGILDDCGLSLSQGDSAGSFASPLDAELLPLDTATTWNLPFHGLSSSSPAVDGGNPAGCRMPITEASLKYDQIEQKRHWGAACDAGAIELSY
ncbi:MAG TPA: choice-of-anchor Q domain-containing protein [Thermoanaerobaculia bacterium]|nr:choice-of-anchor Q domain-containing protein [Thermoanaerobaculia bacterium]